MKLRLDANPYFTYDGYVKLFSQKTSRFSTIVRLGMFILLLIVLPVFIWAVMTQRIELRKKAATSEPTQICWNRVIEQGTTSIPQWPNSCKGNPRTDIICAQVLVPLNTEEIAQYNEWKLLGKPYIPGCGMITPTPTPTPTGVCSSCVTNHICPTGLTCQAVQQGEGGCRDDGAGHTVCYDPAVLWLCAPPNSPNTCRPTPTTIPNCVPYPRCYYPIADIPRCTLQSGVTYCPIYPLFKQTVNGLLSTLTPNQNMPITINVREEDGTPGTPSEGFNVQVAVDHWPSTNSISVLSQNAIFNANTNVWTMLIPRPTILGGYRLQIHAYCEQDDSICAKKYGVGRQIETLHYFNTVNTTPTPQIVFPNCNQRPGQPPVRCPQGYWCKGTCNPLPGQTGCAQYDICVALTPTPSPTPIPNIKQTLELKVKLAGVTDAKAESAKIAVKLYKKDGTIQQLSAPLTLAYVSNGIYKATAILTNPFPAETQFTIKIKGEKHVAIKFCKQVGQTGPCNESEYITVPNPVPLTYGFDLTGIPLPPGDLSPQDGSVTQSDLTRLIALKSIFSADQTADDKRIGDLNYDGTINSFDLFLILQTLMTRHDE